LASPSAPSFGPNYLYELAIAKGVTYDRSMKRPTKTQILLALSKKGISKPDELLRDIQLLKRRLRLSTLIQKAMELGVYSKELGDDKFKLAIHIYCKSKNAMEELNRYYQVTPRHVTVHFETDNLISLDEWLKHEEDIKTEVNQRLTQSPNSITTVDKITRLGNVVQLQVGTDSKTHIVERKESEGYPNREGPYDAFPLRRMTVTFDSQTQILQVSSHPSKTTSIVEAISQALTGDTSAFHPRIPSSTQAVEAFNDPKVVEELEKNGVRITEMKLRNIPLNGNPSYLHLQGENLLDTIKQFDEAGVPILGENLSEIESIAFEMEGSGKITVYYGNGKREITGEFSPEDLTTIESLISGWGA